MPENTAAKKDSNDFFLSLRKKKSKTPNNLQLNQRFFKFTDPC